MTFVNKKARVFMDRGDLKPVRKRSESRLKTYPSAVDLRAWCDQVEDRRQHILELIETETEKCLGKLIPLDAIINALMADKNTSIKELKKCLGQLWKFVGGCSLGNEDKRKLVELKKQMSKICLEAAKYLGSDTEMGGEKGSFRMSGAEAASKQEYLQAQPDTRQTQSVTRQNQSKTFEPKPDTDGISSTSSECPAKERHLREQAEVDALTRDVPGSSTTGRAPTGPSSYTVKGKGPIRMVTRVKGLKPGSQFPVGSITVKAQNYTRKKGTAKNGKVDLKEEQPEEDQISPSERNANSKPKRMSGIQGVEDQKFASESKANERPKRMSAGQRIEDQILASESKAHERPKRMSASQRIEDQILNSESKANDRPKRMSAGQRIEDQILASESKANERPKRMSAGQRIEDQILNNESKANERPRKVSVSQGIEDQISASKNKASERPRKMSGSQGREEQTPASENKASERPKRMSGNQVIAEREQSADIQKAEIEERIADDESMVLGQKYVNGKKPDGDQKHVDRQKAGHVPKPGQKPDDGQKVTDGGRLNNGGGTTVDGMNIDEEETPSSEEDRHAIAYGKKSIKGEKSSDGGKYTDEERGGDIPNELQRLQDQLAARDALCEEQQNSIENLRNERDNLKKRIQDCLLELDGLKKLNNVSDPGVPTSCKEEIEALEQEMLVMRSGNLSPEQEAEVIKKEVEVLKKYCLKLKAIEEENEMLKSAKAIPSGDDEVTPDGLEKIEQLEKERAELAQKVKILEQELQQNKDVPENFEIYKNRSDMLDNALAERDDMQKKLDKMRQMEMQLEEMKEKADRTDELERTLKYYNKNDRNTDYELKRTQSKCICLEKEQQNLRSERDSMSKRIELMNNELESLRSKAKEAEMMKLERDRLQIKLNELSHVQVHNENLMLKCKCLENAAMERDAYKLKYEEILGMECQCEMMKLQIEESRNMARERDALVKQVMDLESCIKDQEEEIKRLVAQIDNLMKNKDETQSRMRDALSNMRAEVEKKDQLIAASEEKLAAVQTQLKSSIQGVSCETLCYKMRIEELERELCGARCRIGKLERQLTEKEEILRGAKRTNKSEYESVGIMKRELEAAKAENNKLQEIAKKMVTLTGDEHVQKMLRQSECAVRRVVEELGKQYREWDHMRSRRQKQRTLPKGCSCNNPNCEDGSDFESADEKLKEELRDIQREKEKLESIVKQIQDADGPQKELVTMRMENEKLQEQLGEEINRRRALEQKLNKILS